MHDRKPDYAEIARLERELGLTDEQIIERGREARRKPRELTAAEATERLERLPVARKASTGAEALAAMRSPKVEWLDDRPQLLSVTASAASGDVWKLVMQPHFLWPVEHHDDIRHS